MTSLNTVGDLPCWSLPNKPNCSHTELFSNQIVLILNCSHTKLFSYWIVLIPNCSHTELFSNQIVLILNCSQTKLFSYWIVLKPNCSHTEDWCTDEESLCQNDGEKSPGGELAVVIIAYQTTYGKATGWSRKLKALVC